MMIVGDGVDVTSVFMRWRRRCWIGRYATVCNISVVVVTGALSELFSLHATYVGGRAASLIDDNNDDVLMLFALGGRFR